MDQTMTAKNVPSKIDNKHLFYVYLMLSSRYLVPRYDIIPCNRLIKEKRKQMQAHTVILSEYFLNSKTHTKDSNNPLLCPSQKICDP